MFESVAATKALQINADGSKYGTFAEIGAAQEVVRWFFRVRGAASTVAKSMSAYDMGVSDTIYGKTDRYVSRRRLLQMLEHEFALNLERLQTSGKQLFAFANSSTTKPARGHAWIGLRFQATIGEDPSQIIIHAVLRDREITAQHETLGILGVNLIYGAFYKTLDPTAVVVSLMDGLSPERVQVDAVEFSGPAFQSVDNRLMALRLVQHNLSEVAAFSATGEVLQLSDILYKRPVIIERGTFRPVTNTHLNILNAATKAFQSEFSDAHHNPAIFMEITMKNLLETAELDPTDFLARADVLKTIDQPVLITSYPEYHRLIGHLRGHQAEPIVLAVGGSTLRQIFDERYYADLEGGMLEGLGKLFRPGVKMYVYPQVESDGRLIHVGTFQPPPAAHYLFHHLVDKGALESIGIGSGPFSRLSSHDVLQALQNGSDSWSENVPSAVADIIRERSLFGYKTPVAVRKSVVHT